MAVQISTSSAQEPIRSLDINATQVSTSRQNGERPVSVNIANDGKDAAPKKEERKETFERLLRASSRGVSDALQKVPSGTGNVSRKMTAEEISRLVAPLLRGVEHVRAMADLMVAELTAGDLKGAASVVMNALEKVSRFDPDQILGKGFTEGSLHEAIRDFLAMNRATPGGVSEQEEVLPPESSPEPDLLDGPGNGGGGDVLARIAEASGDEASNVGSGEGEAATNGDYRPLHMDIAELNPPRRGETADRMKKGPELGIDPTPEARAEFFAERMGFAPKSGDVKENSGNFKESSDLAKLQEDISKERIAQNQGAKKDTGGGNTFSSGENFDEKRFSQMSPAKNGRPPAFAGAMKEQETPQLKGANFAGELAAALRSKLEVPLGTVSPQSIYQTPSTYVLDPSNAFGDGLSTVLRFMRGDGAQEARIVVEPPALGRIDISLQSTASGVEAVFKVDNEHLKQMLQQQIDTLRTSLQAQGIHVSGLAVDIKNRDDRNRGDVYSAGKKHRRVGGVAVPEDDAEAASVHLARLDLEKGLLHWVA